MTGWFDALYTSPELEGPWWRRAIVWPWRVVALAVELIREQRGRKR